MFCFRRLFIDSSVYFHIASRQLTMNQAACHWQWLLPAISWKTWTHHTRVITQITWTFKESYNRLLIKLSELTRLLPPHSLGKSTMPPFFIHFLTLKNDLCDTCHQRLYFYRHRHFKWIIFSSLSSFPCWIFGLSEGIIY